MKTVNQSISCHAVITQKRICIETHIARGSESIRCAKLTRGIM